MTTEIAVWLAVSFSFIGDTLAAIAILLFVRSRN
jgi:hypothetical protein